MTYWFDMDGTIADLYSIKDWLPMLVSENPLPYEIASPLLNLSLLARLIHKVQRAGNQVGIISWTSKNSTASYDIAVAEAKMRWLTKHLPSVEWDFVKIVPYGTNKKITCGAGVLFDDEQRNRDDWGEGAYLPSEIFNILGQ